MSSERERMDDLLMQTREVHCLLFQAPRECRSTDGRDNWFADTEPPGIYLRQNGKGASPIASPNNPKRLLTRDQALTLAGALDAMAQPEPHMGSMGQSREVPYPVDYEALVHEWYEALGRRLHRAISATDDRLSRLRVTRAAITGEVYA